MTYPGGRCADVGEHLPMTQAHQLKIMQQADFVEFTVEELHELPLGMAISLTLASVRRLHVRRTRSKLPDGGRLFMRNQCLRGEALANLSRLVRS